MEFRKFNLINTAKGAHIPPAALSVSGFGKEEFMEGHALSDSVVILKKEMCASELLRAASALEKLAAELYAHLGMVCSHCQDCSDTCPYGPEDFGIDVELPDAIRKAAGIPKEAKLQVDIEEGAAVIRVDDGMPGLRNVPPHIMEAFLADGRCPDDLLDHIMEGDIVYGRD